MACTILTIACREAHLLLQHYHDSISRHSQLIYDSLQQPGHQSEEQVYSTQDSETIPYIHGLSQAISIAVPGS